MSANDSALENWIAQSLKRPHINNQDKETATRPAENKLSDTDRMIAVIEAAATTFDANDPRAVETLFAGQAVALDVIFKDFIRRRSFTFDNMRVALRAQAQCRSTFKTLADFRTPRQRVARNSNEQTIETGKARDDQELT